MDKRLIQSARQLNKRRRRRRTWIRGLLVLSCAVALGTIYVMSLPAITQEKGTYCGYEAHEHTTGCYRKLSEDVAPEPICALQEMEAHIHSDDCYVANAESEHVHEDACYEMVGGHIHGDDCYGAIEGHVHEDSCYEITAGHVHGDSCYELIGGHVHGEACYEVIGGHTHGEACYERIGGHTHGDGCYQIIKGHTHGAECYDEENRLICTSSESEDSTQLSCETPESAAESILICTSEEAEGTLSLCCELEETEESRNLICTLEETEEQRVLICTEAEVEGRGELICTEPESEGEKTLVCTADKTLICTLTEQEAHTHTEECYGEADEPILTCTLAESEEHHHFEVCYGDWELVCDQEVHIHKLSCYSNPGADVESAEQWEKTFRDVKITGLHREDVVAIARTQLGYRESDRNYTVKEDGKTIDGYTRYGDWFGYRYGDGYGYRYSEWCAMFVSFCLEYAQVPDIPYHAACQAWINLLAEQNLYADAAEVEPLPGYIVFFDVNGDRYSDHVGLVEEIKEDGTVITIEGNNCRMVARGEYEAGDPRLLGYGVIPEGELLQEEEPAESKETIDGEAPTDGEVPAEGELPTDGEMPTEGEEPTEEATEPAEAGQKVPVYLNSKREDLVVDADKIYLTGELPAGASIFAVPVTMETEEEILSAYQITILLPDFTTYYPTPEDNLLLTVKNPEFEEKYLQIRLCSAEGDYRVLPGTTGGQSVTFPLEASEPFAIVKMPEPTVEQTIRAVIYTDETFQELAEDETTILITGMLSEGVTARAYPVALQEDLIAGQTVLLAYDITIVDRDGNLIESSEVHPFVVQIQPPGWTPSDDENYNIFYVPKEGEPELIVAQSQEDSVSFTTDHFSTYALTASGTSATIYLNGSSGNDSNNGTANNRAVKTLEKALTLVKDGGTIYITGTVTITDDQEWDMVGEVTIKRYSNFTGPLVKVTNGGSLTLKNITINGGSGTPSSSSIATNTTYASGSAKAPLIVVESGATLNIRDGAVLEYNSNKPDTNSGGTNIVINGYVGMGGAVYCQGNLNMSGGTIRYCEAQCGGGIYIESSGGWITFNLTGGTITYNYARDIVPVPNSGHKAYHKNAGGGVYVGDYVTMNMSGGVISNNQSSREGGGVSLGWLNRNRNSAIYEYITRFNMTGGTFTGNYATSTGGGLNVTAGRAAEISAGYFTSNTANGLEYQPGDSSKSWTVYSGGAIYLDAKQFDSSGNYAGKPGYAKIHRVLIANNSADLYGGGIATCSTSSGTVNASVELDGTLIYNNTAGSGGNEMYLQGDTTLVGNKMLGGGTYSWSKSGNKYDNSLTENSSDVKNGKPMATVIITGNHAGVDGGGIGCNGEIEIGGQPETVSISITKIWNDDGTVAHPDSIQVQVYKDGQPYGDPVTIYPSVDESGKETWPTVYVDNLPEDGKYTIKEVKVPGFDSEVKGSGNNFTITNTPTGFTVVKKWVGDTANDRPDFIQVQLFQDGIAYGNPVKLTATNNWKYMWMELPEGYTYTAQEVEVPDGYYITGEGESLDADTWQITNTLSPVTSISVEKRWQGGDPLDSVTVYLLSNGVQIGEATLSSANGWFYKWENLPVYGKLGAELEYTVEEASVRGFASSIREANSADATRSWVQANGFADGKTYLLVSDEGALTVNSSNTLEWTDESAVLSGGAAESSQIWTYNSNKLQNDNGKYLALDSTGNIFNLEYFFGAANSGSNISWSGGYLSTTAIISTRYFGAIGNEGTASAPTEKSSATRFTLYEYSSNEGSWGEEHYIITNTKLPDSIEFRFAKYAVGSTSEPTLLAGAQLELYKVSESGDVTIPGTDQTGTLIRSWTSENGTGENGGYRIEDLYSGIYYLIETHTPDGHAGLSGPIVFEVQAEAGQVNVISSPYELTLGSGSAVDFPIYNKVTYELPQTGGAGTTPYTIGGLLLIVIALVLLLYNNKRRRGAATSY